MKYKITNINMKNKLSSRFKRNVSINGYRLKLGSSVVIDQSTFDSIDLNMVAYPGDAWEPRHQISVEMIDDKPIKDMIAETEVERKPLLTEADYEVDDDMAKPEATIEEIVEPAEPISVAVEAEESVEPTEEPKLVAQKWKGRKHAVEDAVEPTEEPEPMPEVMEEPGTNDDMDIIQEENDEHAVDEEPQMEPTKPRTRKTSAPDKGEAKDTGKKSTPKPRAKSKSKED